MFNRHLGQILQCRLQRRPFTSASWNLEGLDAWIASKKELSLTSVPSSQHLSDLYITLPTRDGTRRAYSGPEEGLPLGYAHHLVCFHPRHPERDLRLDGTDADFCPPEPFTRRMWAGGKFEWKKPLLIGERAQYRSMISSVEKKGFEKGSPMVFVKQNIEVSKERSSEACIKEERSHVYQPADAPVKKRVVREVKDLPASNFSLTYTPSLTTLFRFSALTFNGHYIHLDKDYAQNVEGYPRLVKDGGL